MPAKTGDLQEWAACYDRVIWIDQVPWRASGKILSPLTMPHTALQVSRKKVREALAVSKALLARWTSDWDRAESQWWWTCCDDRQYDLKTIKSVRARRGIRKGLDSCSVMRLGPEEFIGSAYEIHVQSLKAYGLRKSQIPTKTQYQDEILRKSRYQGAEYWGALVKGRLAAFSTCVVVDRAVSLGSTKSNPEFHRCCSNNALFYTVTKHYLCERGLRYVTNGCRTLLHSTTINDFLIRMGFRRVFCRLDVELSTLAKAMCHSGIGRWGKYLGASKIAPAPWRKIEGFQKLVDISHTF